MATPCKLEASSGRKRPGKALCVCGGMLDWQLPNNVKRPILILRRKLTCIQIEKKREREKGVEKKRRQQQRNIGDLIRHRW